MEAICRDYGGTSDGGQPINLCRCRGLLLYSTGHITHAPISRHPQTQIPSECHSFLRWLWRGGVSIYVLASSPTVVDRIERRFEDFLWTIYTLSEADLLYGRLLSSSNLGRRSTSGFGPFAVPYLLYSIAKSVLGATKFATGYEKDIKVSIQFEDR